MLIKRLFIICSLSTFLAGCSEFFGSQPPAPVYGGESTVYNRTTPSLPKPKEPKPIISEPIGPGSNEIVKTKPLKEFVPRATPIEALTPEPLTQEQQGQESLAPDQGALTTEQGSSSLKQEPGTSEKETAAPSPTEEPVVSAPKQEYVAPPPPPPPHLHRLLYL